MYTNVCVYVWMAYMHEWWCVCMNEMCVYEWCLCIRMMCVYVFSICVLYEWCTYVGTCEKTPSGLWGFWGFSSWFEGCVVNVFNHWAVLPASDFFMWQWREMVSDGSLPCLAPLLYVFFRLLTELSVLRSPEELVTPFPPASWILPVLWELWLLDNCFTLANIAPALKYHNISLLSATRIRPQIWAGRVKVVFLMDAECQEEPHGRQTKVLLFIVPSVYWEFPGWRTMYRS